jgi:hypothetical protein
MFSLPRPLHFGPEDGSRICLRKLGICPQGQNTK